MKEKVSVTKFHEALVSELFASPPSDDDVLCLMMLLHGCRIVLSHEADVEGGITGFEGIATRHAAEVVAKLFTDKPRTDPGYWYWKWNADWDAYAILESVPTEMAPRLRRAQQLIESHPWVDKLEDEIWPITSD